jgi:predicted nucleic acid-binding Zn ribbon protein
MPTYHYACDNGCTFQDAVKKRDEINKKRKDFTVIMVNSERLVWEEKHRMSETPKIKCPVCGKKANRTIEGIKAPLFYFPGNCYLNKDECRRRMDLHKLETGQDPYAYMRQPGEVDQIKKELKNPKKSKPKYFTT